MSTAVTLVGGFTLDAYRKYQLKAHKMLIQSVMKRASDTAFINDAPILVGYSNDVFTLKRKDKTVLDFYEFEDVIFESGNITVERTGFFSRREIAFHYRKNRHTVHF